MVEKQKCKVMQIKRLDQDLRVRDLRLHQLSTNGDFLKESTADQTCLIDEREILEKRIQREIDRLLRTSSTFVSQDR